MGSFMSKHCNSGINYGSPLNQGKEHVPAELKDPEFLKRLESLPENVRKNMIDRIKRRDSLAIAKHGSIEAMKQKQIEAESKIKNKDKKDDY